MKLRLEDFGDKVQGVRITGNPANAEKEAFRIAFPWGDVEVVRATDTNRPDYWIHIRTNRPDDGQVTVGVETVGQIISGRIDGDISEVWDIPPDVYHIAVRIGKG